jgi:hypothetical protein
MKRFTSKNSKWLEEGLMPPDILSSSIPSILQTTLWSPKKAVPRVQCGNEEKEATTGEELSFATQLSYDHQVDKMQLKLFIK